MACSCNDPVPLLPTPLQPLYAYKVSPEGGPGCVFSIPAMTVFVYPFWLCPGKVVEINAILTARGQQDNSLRLWIAKRPLGNPVIEQPMSLNTWMALRAPTRLVTVFDRETPPSTVPDMAAALVSGPYLLHVLNQTNFVNEFSLRLAEVGGIAAT